jgi:hypothetical protein
MIDEIREIITNSQKDEYLPYKALLDLKDSGKHYSIDNICLATHDTLNTKKFIQVNAIFESNKINFEINFLIEALTSSYLFNLMMMNENEPTNEINEEIADAIKEIISTINGNIATTINGASLEDIGEIKISTNDYKLIENFEEFQGSDTFVQYNLKIEEKIFEFVLNLSDEAKKFFSEILQKEPCVSEQNIAEEETQEENTQQSEQENNQESLQPESKENNASDQSTNEVKKDAKEDELVNKTKEDENNDDEQIKKDKKLKLIIIIVATLLVLVLAGFGIMYFMGYFDPPPPPTKKIKPNPRKNKLLPIKIEDKKIDFKIDMINVNRLNKRLALLTKYEILENDILAKFKQEEELRLHRLKIQQLEAFAKANKEESIKNIKKDNFSIKNRQIYIQIEPLKYKKYKKIIDSKLPVNSSISICKDSNSKVKIYVGPLLDKDKANILVKDIKSLDNGKDTQLISLTKKEFDKLCDF